MADFVSISALAQMLEDGLNAISTQENFVFNIIANAGDFKESEKPNQRQEARKIINGVLTPQPSAIIPVAGLNNYYMQMTFSMPVPKDYVERVSAVVNTYIKSQVGALVSVEGYAGVCNFDMLTLEGLTMLPTIGTGSVLYTNVYYQFIENGVLSNECIFVIDGQSLLITEWAVGRTKVPQTDNVTNSETMLSLMVGQGLQVSLTVPYINQPIYKLLFEEMWNGALNTAHKITYYDGIISTMDKPLTKNMALVTATNVGEAGKIPMLQFAFTEVYGG